MLEKRLLEKILVAILLIFPLGFLLGFFFPMGMRFSILKFRKNTTWFWALNGVFSVLFSAIAVFISIYAGISFNFYLAAACYATLAFVVKKFR
jgi:hypothetical protein